MELIGLLMWEHRLIEKIITPLQQEQEYITKHKQAHPAKIIQIVDFFRTYADKFHHGKEEDILFKELAKKPLKPEHQKTMDELTEEHRYARQCVGQLMEATEKWSTGDQESLTTITDNLNKLIQLYPKHIEKEDKHFFHPIQNYFTKQERENLLQAGYRFDQEFTNKNYRERMKKLLE